MENNKPKPPLEIPSLIKNKDNTEEIKIKNQFSFKSSDRLGDGAFGQIFKGINIKTKEEVAIKIESKNSPTPLLLHEYKILKSLSDCENFPKIFLITPLEDVLILIMELFGENLEKIMQKMPNKKFSLKTSIMLGIQILNRIKTLHENNYIHRDIKPENFVIGLKKRNNTIYMIDYGLTRKFFDNHKKEHIAYREGKNLTGTVKFASLYTHLGIEQSRRDDLESLGYMLIYFCKGDLPWTKIKGKNKKEKYNLIKEKKMEVMPDILCEGLDNEFKDYFNYVRKLQFTEEPNYEFLNGILNKILIKNKLKYDLKFDWCIDNSEKRVDNNIENNEKKSVISTELLFSKLKLGCLDINNGNSGNKNKEEKEKSKDDINKFSNNFDNSNINSDKLNDKKKERD